MMQLEALLETAREGVVDSIAAWPKEKSTSMSTSRGSSFNTRKSFNAADAKKSIFKLFADIHAPIVVVPFDPDMPTGKSAIFDLGRLVVKHGLDSMTSIHKREQKTGKRRRVRKDVVVIRDAEDVEDEDEAAGKPIMNRNDISIKSFSQDVWRILTYW